MPFVLSLVQILQAIKQGGQIKDIRKELQKIRLDQNKTHELLETVLKKLPPDASPADIVEATTDAIMNTSIERLFMPAYGDSHYGDSYYGATKTKVEPPPKDMPPTTGPFGKGTEGE